MLEPSVLARTLNMSESARSEGNVGKWGFWSDASSTTGLDGPPLAMLA